MGIKVNRIWFKGYYPAKPVRLAEYGYQTFRPMRKVLSVLSADQGMGRVSGVVEKNGVILADCPVMVFKKSNRLLLWEIRSRADGSYNFRNILEGMECFIVAFDPANQYNAVIQDKLIATKAVT